ncbi:hypothetical protein FIBSPDRAFT_860438 [Athelia psychrophila]|uniref:Uncharacterized protein n=1 Tax=Athelia psychrophila TaxID=1759441 RepID=A0A166K4F6_9AGAM|nr:hypothetical protein FIBSPDRAFT_860438 [Fibularhizoctonia sp. CBS 109695]
MRKHGIATDPRGRHICLTDLQDDSRFELNSSLVLGAFSCRAPVIHIIETHCQTRRSIATTSTEYYRQSLAAYKGWLQVYPL